MPIPYSPALEKVAVPDKKAVFDAVKALLVEG